MLALELLAERRIEEALARGDFDDLPGAGRPLGLDDDALVPEDLRMAYRILKNAGFAPPEVQTLREIAELERAVLAGDARGLRKLALLRTSLEPRYAGRVIARLGGRPLRCR
jgi:hypothetical protein